MNRLWTRKAWILSAVIGACLVLGCSGLTKRPDDVHTRDAETMDTYVHTEEEGILPPGAPLPEEEEPPPVISPVPEQEETVPETPAPSESASIDIRHVSGYRVQLFATRDPEAARVFAESSRNHFDAKVYVEYLEPYYKVRVGDCLTREESTLLLEKARKAGFEEAWIAATLVLRVDGEPR